MYTLELFDFLLVFFGVYCYNIAFVWRGRIDPRNVNPCEVENLSISIYISREKRTDKSVAAQSIYKRHLIQ